MARKADPTYGSGFQIFGILLSAPNIKFLITNLDAGVGEARVLLKQLVLRL